MPRKKPPTGTPDQPAPSTESSGAPAPEPPAIPASSAEPGDTLEAASARRFPIVGIGASAGGLAAFEAFFSAIPRATETGMAFVLVQHLAPDHKSILTDLVKRHTRMQVCEVEDGMRVQPDCAYIIPPNFNMTLFNGILHLLEPTEPRGLRLPIDVFFRSLAQDQRERALCVVLSGTGSDGTLGARAIKGEGGMVMVQTPESAGYDGMPRSVIATGLTDFILPPAEMPAQLMAYVAHAFGKGAYAVAPSPKAEDTLAKICILLRDKTGHDFSQYKQSTLVRRIERRMALHQIERQGDYVRYLQRDPAEIDALFRDLLIGVTSFFRDPEAFAALQQEAIPRLFANKPAGGTVRVWVCGCSTGEEAYSIAILLQEHQETLRQAFKIQVFATDIDPRAIEQARVGIYPANIAADVSPERLARFFAREPQEDVYRIQKGIRDLLIFSEQDLIRDPPFSRLDLISCRNLLIYVNADLQKKLITLFHYALNPEGLLFLGNSETVGEAMTFFMPINRKWKVYQRQTSLDRLPAPILGDLLSPLALDGAQPPASAVLERRDGRLDLRILTERALLSHYEPVAILTNGRGEILYIHGRTGQYLEPAPGDPEMNVFTMAREGLRRPLTTALHQAVSRKDLIQAPGLRVKTNGDHTLVNLTVRPTQAVNGGVVLSDLYLVILERAASAPAETVIPGDGETATAGQDRDQRIAELELELRAKEEYLQTTLEEMETSNEELKSTNEEMQSVNEELQSTNEELETSKEELQSVNEELATVNAELQTKVADLSRANNDMNNLLAGTGVATLFVDHQLRITRFTPAATQLIKLIQTDIGRPVGDLVSNLVDYNGLVDDLQTVLNSLIPQEKQVMTHDGAWYLMRIGPYRTLENVIEGAVITFMDISGPKRAESALRASRALAERIVDGVPVPFLVLDAALRVISANQAFCDHFQVTAEETLGRALDELGNGQWRTPALYQWLSTIQSQEAPLVTHEITHAFPQLGTRTMRLKAIHLDSPADQAGAILLAIEDIT